MQATRADRTIFLKLFLLGFVAVGMIIGSVVWLTGRIDQIERETGANLVGLMVTETVDQVQAAVADYAHWNLAYDIVQANDIDAIHEHLGSGALESDLFDLLLVISAQGEVQYLFSSVAGFPASAPFDVAEIAPFLNGLTAHAPSSYVSVSGIGRVQGAYAAIASSWITPDAFRHNAAARLPILVGMVLFTEDKLAAIEQLTKGTGFAIRDSVSTVEEPSVVMLGPDATPVAQLVWTPTEPGTMLRGEIMPGILLVCASIFAICISAARYFYKQSQVLERARRVATTDQLTGLLNRSGLDEVLHTPGVKAQVAAGHAGILYLDLNDFKTLNDRHGHKDGDRALKITAQRLQAAVRSSDHAVRLGGDEFICLVLDDDPETATQLVAARVQESCNHPISFADHQMILRPSIGVAVASVGVDWETLLSQADAAMYLAKRTKAEGPMRFSVSMGHSLKDPDQPASAVA